jgi:predicted flap endonuclease-1-like 5' DNA nuclease
MFEQQVNLGPGTGTFTQHTFEIIVMLLGAFLLGLWLGWLLWNRYKQEADKLRLDIQSQAATNSTLTNEINGLKAKLATANNDNTSLRSQTDLLTEENYLLREKLTKTADELAQVEERNRQLETELGLTFAAEPPTPETIPLEINLTSVTPAEETPEVILVEKQEVEINLEPVPPPATEQKSQDTVAAPVAEIIAPQAEKPVAASVSGDEKDDLTVIEGIGPKIQELLYQYGVRTYHQLADTEVARLKEILAEAGPQLAMHDPGTWPSQANLAANDQWEALKSIQGFLKGGKKPT